MRELLRCITYTHYFCPGNPSASVQRPWQRAPIVQPQRRWRRLPRGRCQQRQCRQCRQQGLHVQGLQGPNASGSQSQSPGAQQHKAQKATQCWTEQESLPGSSPLSHFRKRNGRPSAATKAPTAEPKSSAAPSTSPTSNPTSSPSTGPTASPMASIKELFKAKGSATTCKDQWCNNACTLQRLSPAPPRQAHSRAPPAGVEPGRQASR